MCKYLIKMFFLFFVPAQILSAQDVYIVAQGLIKFVTYDQGSPIFTNSTPIQVLDPRVIEFDPNTGLLTGKLPGTYVYYFGGSGSGGGVDLIIQKIFANGSTSDGVGIPNFNNSVQVKVFTDYTGGPNPETGVIDYRIFLFSTNDILVHQVFLQIYFSPETN